MTHWKENCDISRQENNISSWQKRMMQRDFLFRSQSRVQDICRAVDADYKFPEKRKFIERTGDESPVCHCSRHTLFIMGNRPVQIREKVYLILSSVSGKQVTNTTRNSIF